MKQPKGIHPEMKVAHLISNEASPSQVRDDAHPASPHPPSQALLGFPAVQVTSSITPTPGSTVTADTLLPAPKSHGNGGQGLE